MSLFQEAASYIVPLSALGLVVVVQEYMVRLDPNTMPLPESGSDESKRKDA
jgi:hypothetical protein